MNKGGRSEERGGRRKEEGGRRKKEGGRRKGRGGGRGCFNIILLSCNIKRFTFSLNLFIHVHVEEF
jgi:hypothetical protein